ncbi:hypothetical protein EVAR_66310_1 [Eumeta japonica]|uniref:Uncharacterized protein n=1 Tax=Eumeta variegata TaxID=151549 RepID=A0A4C1ZAF1_EUMVA|nr:hypothetical protein EVAR_66310_1 [Eumeta japonica]
MSVRRPLYLPLAKDATTPKLRLSWESPTTTDGSEHGVENLRPILPHRPGVHIDRSLRMTTHEDKDRNIQLLHIFLSDLRRTGLVCSIFEAAMLSTSSRAEFCVADDYECRMSSSIVEVEMTGKSPALLSSEGSEPHETNPPSEPKGSCPYLRPKIAVWAPADDGWPPPRTARRGRAEGLIGGTEGDVAVARLARSRGVEEFDVPREKSDACQL